MINFGILRSLVALRLLRILRDRTSLIWLLIMPMVFSFLMGQLMGDWGGGSAGSLPRCLVVAPGSGAEVDSLLAPLQDNAKFRLDRRDTTIAEEVVRDWLDRSRITAALYIPADFAETLGDSTAAPLRLFYDSDRLSSQTVRTVLEESILRGNAIAAARRLVREDESAALLPGESRAFDEATFERWWNDPRVFLEAETLGRVETEEFALTRASQHVGPAYIIFFVLMFLMMSAKELVAERKDRTLARLVASRASTLDLVLGYFLAGMSVGLIQAGILLVLNSLAFGLDYGDSVAGLVLVVLLTAGVASAASILLGCVARSTAQADGLGMAVTMTMAAVGGLWWPLEIVPEFMQTIGKALPTGQAITIFHDLIGRGYGVAELSPLLLGLTLWFVVLISLATWRLRRHVLG